VNDNLILLRRSQIENIIWSLRHLRCNPFIRVYAPDLYWALEAEIETLRRVILNGDETIRTRSHSPTVKKPNP